MSGKVLYMNFILNRKRKTTAFLWRVKESACRGAERHSPYWLLLFFNRVRLVITFSSFGATKEPPATASVAKALNSCFFFELDKEKHCFKLQRPHNCQTVMAVMRSFVCCQLFIFVKN
ncbi:MAG TPA: hypothetical protein VHO66_04240 [Ruminiclostridium sp.]|nr:hypothetical protein [Ruminiclostridium sp.]